MRLRIFFGKFLIRLGRFIQSLAVIVMRPVDLIEFSRQIYANPEDVKDWGSKDQVDLGLSKPEKDLLEKIPIKQGRLLLLGVGGGREAIPIAKTGFSVTGVDFINGMVEKAKENALRHGVKITGLVQEISQLKVPEESYDVVWLSAAMYSSIPTKERRIRMLQKIWKALQSGGYCVCQFYWDRRYRPDPKWEFARRTIAWLTLGNLFYEKGDMLWGNIEFIHAFSSEEELEYEFKLGGFKTFHIQFPDKSRRGGALLQKVDSPPFDKNSWDFFG